MKKLISLGIVVALLLSLCGCAKKGGTSSNTNSSSHSSSYTEQKQEDTSKEPVKQPEPEKQPEKQPEKEQSNNGIRPEFKASMESYEAFFDEYVKFMKSYDGSLTQMLKYTDFLAKYADAMEKLDKIGDEELTHEELALYTETMLRIQKKLLEIVD